MAVVSNRPDTVTGLVDLPLIVDWPNKPLQKVDYLQGKSSRTYYRVTDFAENSNTARLDVVPVTGRTHQIRVHLQSIGHPLLGDRLYAPEDITRQADRLLLHASTLEFYHPLTKLLLKIYSEPEF